jgi:DNA polymerase III delta prime subunit
MRKILLLNGPPGSGKSTAAAYLRRLDFTELKASAPIKRAFEATYNLPTGTAEHWKDRFIGDGVTGRQWMIDFSEKFMKPLFGEDVFGLALRDNIKLCASNEQIVVSDTGFQAEVEALRELDQTENSIRLIQLDRIGCKWDSRQRVRWDTHDYRVYNDGIKGDLYRELDSILINWE